MDDAVAAELVEAIRSISAVLSSIGAVEPGMKRLQRSVDNLERLVPSRDDWRMKDIQSMLDGIDEA